MLFGLVIQFILLVNSIQFMSCLIVLFGSLQISLHKTLCCCLFLSESKIFEISCVNLFKSDFTSLDYSPLLFHRAVDQIELHMFGDSSQDVFCAVGFLRARLSSSHKIQISSIFGKACVAPMKALSIPKLELQAALLCSPHD